jgi:hypothetical protein
MKVFLLIFFVILLFCSSVNAVEFKIGGVYTAWAQTQKAFNFDKEAYAHHYVVQMLRFKFQGIANENLRFVTRLDIAQGWWGVDNVLKSKIRTDQAGGSALFDFKGTNFLVHIDQAYIDFKIPETPFGFRVGRMWYGLGNKIMIDNNYDGIQMDIAGVLGEMLTFGWARVSEGVDGLDDKEVTTPDQRGFSDGRDADLLSIDIFEKFGDLAVHAYGFYYTDRSIADSNAYIPDHLQYFKSRFSAQISNLYAFGLSGTWNIGALSLNAEFDYLFGEDKINNPKIGNKQLVDLNNGDLSGYNLYLKGNYAVSDKVAVGGVFGLGSGDDNVTSGNGNVNKLRTSGFFYITEVWEDSIMPDEEGITPQGLGAPNVRGYRELENTTILQVNTTLNLLPKFTTFLSYNYIVATNAIPAWSVIGDDTHVDYTKTATNLGQEIDFRFNYKLMDELALIFRGGYFMPGDAAGYLIRGNTDKSDAAWEMKGIIAYKF